MMSKTSKTSYLLGAALASAFFTASAQAHECRALGQSNNGNIGQYWLCVGFAVEDGDRPRAGTLNNLDFFPFWVDGPDFSIFESVDTREGDIVDITAILSYNSTAYYEVATDENFVPLDPWIFFKQPGVGYEVPLAVPPFLKKYKTFVPVDAEGAVAYRVPDDFITPYAGLYDWVVKGKIQRQGHEPVTFFTKWTSLQPRIPFGPFESNGTNLLDLRGGPEGWFDGVKPSTAVAAAGTSRKAKSPRASSLMKLHKVR